MANLVALAQNFSTTLNVGGGIDASQTSGIVLTSVTGLPTDGGILCLDWSSTLDADAAEYIEYTGISGNTLTGVTRGVEGLSAKAHNNGCTVVGIISKSHINRIKDKLTGDDTGVTLDSPTLTTPVISGSAGAAPTTAGVLQYDSTANTLKYGNGSTTVEIAANEDGWTSAGETWTYASATTFTVSGVDVTSKYQKGTRIKLTQTTAKYFVVTGSSFSTDTTVTVTGGTDYTLANAPITSPSYSYQASPQGYPGVFTTTVGTIEVIGKTCIQRGVGSWSFTGAIAEKTSTISFAQAYASAPQMSGAVTSSTVTALSQFTGPQFGSISTTQFIAITRPLVTPGNPETIGFNWIAIGTL